MVFCLCSRSLSARSSQAAHRAEFPLIVLFRFPGPPLSPVSPSTQYIWNTRFATSSPHVVACISGPPFCKGWLSSRHSGMSPTTYPRLADGSHRKKGRRPFHLSLKFDELRPTEIEHGIVGLIESETIPGRIDFSVIDTITLVSKDSSMLTLQVDLFPNIFADELVRTRPSYSDLKKNFTATKTIRIRLVSDSGQPLALVGKDTEEKAPRQGHRATEGHTYRPEDRDSRRTKSLVGHRKRHRGFGLSTSRDP